MEAKLRLLMFNFRLQTEASLYASDLKFKLCDDFSSYRGEAVSYGSSKSDDNIIVLNNYLSKIINMFEIRLKKISEEAAQSGKDTSDNAIENASAALYFASYYHEKNKSCDFLINNLGTFEDF